MALLAVGIGCRSGCPPEAIAALVRRALDAVGGVEPAALFTSVDKQGEAGIAAASVALALPLVYLPRAVLAAAAPGAVTRSERVVALFGVPSIAETAALAGAGPGSALIVPRMAADGATCAVARPAVRGMMEDQP
jgi:cobalt-precorrin 5A hydrolase